MSVRDIIAATESVQGAWFTLGRWAETESCDISGMPKADRDYLRKVCDPEHITLMESVCAASTAMQREMKKPPYASRDIRSHVTALHCCNDRLAVYREMHGLGDTR